MQCNILSVQKINTKDGKICYKCHVGVQQLDSSGNDSTIYGDVFIYNEVTVGQTVMGVRCYSKEGRLCLSPLFA